MSDPDQLRRLALAAIRRTQHLEGRGIADPREAAPEVRRNSTVVGVLDDSVSLPRSISWPHSQPNWNLLRESSIDQELFVAIRTPCSIPAIMASRSALPGSMLRLAMRSIG